MNVASELTEGQLSAFTPTESGGVLVHLDRFEPIDDAKYAEQRPRLLASVNEFQRAALFQEWIKTRRNAAQLKTNLRG